MKKFVIVLLLLVFCVTLFGCSQTDSDVALANALIKEASVEGTKNYTSYDGALTESVRNLCATLTEKLVSPDANTAISPVSIYFALAMMAECASGETRTEILNVLGVDYETLSTNMQSLCSIMNAYYTYRSTSKNEGINSRLITANSVWLDESIDYKTDCLETLADTYNSSSYRADFKNDISGANELLRSYVKKQTQGLIDRYFDLDAQTVFALVNTLYMKEVWNSTGSDSTMTSEKFEFTKADGTSVLKHFLQRGYSVGVPHYGNGFSSYYTTTCHGYKIYFILPDEDVSAISVMTKDNVVEALTASYNGIDEENKIKYLTRCRFPEFHASYDGNVRSALASLGMNKAFSLGSADFSTLTDTPTFCKEIRHVTDLTVNKKGIEGAAVTVMSGVSSSGPGTNKYTFVYDDFDVGRAFGYVITDRYDIPIFSGIINSI